MLYIKLVVSLEFRCLLLLAVDTDVSMVIDIVGVLDIDIDVCSDVGSVGDGAIDIADGLDIVMEVVSDVGLEVDTGVSIGIGMVDDSDIVIDVCFDVVDVDS